MDTQTKQFFVCAILGSAKQFAQARKRSRVISTDIHDAIHALGLRPLYYSFLEVNGDEIVSSTAEYVTENGFSGKFSPIDVSVQLVDDTEWTDTLDSSDNFRKRKHAFAVPTTPATNRNRLTSKSKQYIQKIVAGEVFATPPTDTDLLVASWFLGLHFTNTVLSPNKAKWGFVRNCIWFLDLAINQYSSLCSNSDHRECVVLLVNGKRLNFPKLLIQPWIAGLNCIVNADSGFVLEEGTADQQALIQRVCRTYLPMELVFIY